MSLTLAEVEHIARLAHLELTEEEKNRFREQLSAILEYAARLQEVDTRSISPTAWTFNAQAPLREDVPAQGLSTAEVLSNAPQVQEDQFRVPPVLEG